jgi:hypothetical protein
MRVINVFDTIQIPDEKTDVEVALIVGFADFSKGKIRIKPIGGTEQVITPDAKPEVHYSLGSPADLITKHIRMVCGGYLADPQGTSEGSFLATCAFFQGDQCIQSSQPVSGKFAKGEAMINFNIICSFG